MLSNVVITLVLLITTAFILKKWLALPHNIFLLFIIQPLVMASSPVIVFIGGILSSELSTDKSLATLPITLMIVGVATAAIPAAMLAKKLGRKAATLFGFSLGLVGCVLAMIATQIASFTLFSLASLSLGFCAAFVQQLRFAAIESTKNQEDVPSMLSVLMLSGIFSAFLGPEIAVTAKDWISSPHGYTGSFAFIAVLLVIAMIIFTQFDGAKPIINTGKKSGRAMKDIISQPLFIIAMLSAAIGFALMSYLMTATPISMHHMHGHSLLDTKWVIQSHIAAMFVPSLFTGWLVKKIGLKHLMFIGTLLYAVVAVIAYSGMQVIHYWWALLLLGVGWNFLFLTGTSLLPRSYHEDEKHKVQAFNDFVIFGCQASASLLAGVVLYQFGWAGVVTSSLPFIAILLLLCIKYYRQKAL
ncbi:MFS transporter [Thalassotalea sp. 1_MG-2023]|uniref:MFS transporter n=1 Tax=Thalassotalea sp. 1_MG-2023 TaxID=3062680 RepID=UPI0026E1FFF9|nr:MFS transporter [Thalassotalea sp. 1_MG-2023]MDO6427880.1 MFS transporter [Thalassotalea sp. 1_MG-2023]